MYGKGTGDQIATGLILFAGRHRVHCGGFSLVTRFYAGECTAVEINVRILPTSKSGADSNDELFVRAKVGNQD
jgi:hypothetical protein